MHENRETSVLSEHESSTERPEKAECHKGSSAGEGCTGSVIVGWPPLLFLIK